MAWVATAVVGSAVIGAATTAYTSNKASEAQTAAADKASGVAQQQYQQTRADLEPYRVAGADAYTTLKSRLQDLTAPIVMDQATLEATPGYQFTRGQGLKAVQNSAAARGLGSSGAALKGAATFATGLADSTYQNQFNNANINKTNEFNRLKSLVDTGQNAAAQTGSSGQAAATTSANAAIGAGNAQAAGVNATGGAITNAVNNIGGYATYRGLYSNPTANQPNAVANYNSGNPIY